MIKLGEKAKKDIEFLWSIGSKNIVYKEYRDSIKRLSILSKALDKQFIRGVELR